MSDYQPIPCADHDRLELAAMHGTPVQLSYRDEAGQTQTETHARIVDVQTRDGAEWLTFKLASGESKSVRLDAITAFAELKPRKP